MRNRRLNLQNRRLQLLSNIIQNYQDDIRFALRLIEYDLDITQMQMNQERVITRANIDTALPTSRNTRTPSSRTPRTNSLFADNGLSENRNAYTNDIFSDVPRRTYIYTQLYAPFSQQSETETGITNEQLESATVLMNYDASINETRCPISLDAFEPGQQVLKINVCGHVFSENALREWCNRHSSCPLCRKSLIEDDEQPPTASVESEPISTSPIQTRASSPATNNSNAINQLLSSVLTEFTGTINNSTNDSVFDMSDLLNAYNQLISNTPRTNTRNTQ